MMMTDAQQSSEIVFGRLLVSSVPTTVLFDSGASNSFVSRAFVERNELYPQGLSQQLSIVSPGSKTNTSAFVPDVEIHIQGLPFSASLIVLTCSDIDVILGMDWLVQHKANIDCPTRSVKLTHESGA